MQLSFAAFAYLSLWARLGLAILSAYLSKYQMHLFIFLSKDWARLDYARPWQAPIYLPSNPSIHISTYLAICLSTYGLR